MGRKTFLIRGGSWNNLMCKRVWDEMIVLLVMFNSETAFVHNIQYNVDFE